MMNILDELSREHKKAMAKVRLLESAIAELKQGNPISSRTLQEVSRFLGKELLLHFETEEEAVFPLLAKVMGMEVGTIPLKVFEHYFLRGKISEYQDAVQRFESEGEGAKDKLITVSKELTQGLRAHAREEYTILFPLAKRILTEEQLKEAGKIREEIYSRAGQSVSKP